MTGTPEEDGLHVIDLDDESEIYDEDMVEEGEETSTWVDGDAEEDLESLRAAFVDAFNARNLDDLLAMVADDVEVPDIAGDDGREVLAREIEAIWSNAPALLLTRAFVDGEPCALAWLPDEGDFWARTALLCFEHEGDRITLVSMSEDADRLQRAAAEAPDIDELDEWSDWTEWETGAETQLHSRQSV